MREVYRNTIAVPTNDRLLASGNRGLERVSVRKTVAIVVENTTLRDPTMAALDTLADCRAKSCNSCPALSEISAGRLAGMGNGHTARPL